MTKPTQAIVEQSSPLQDKLTEIITQIQSGVIAAKDFAVEQLPDIAQSYVAYGRAEATVFLLLWSVMFIVGVYLSYYFVVKRKDMVHDWGYWTIERTFGLFCSVCVVISGFVGSLAVASNFLLVWFAPKVWLLKEIAGMLK